jgi:rubredoxin
LKLPEFYLPYYEGFSHSANSKYWLGIYKRNELFLIELLKDICNVCFKTRVGQLYTTPWKSLLIKGINEADCSLWRNILNKYRLNIRHAYNELNWQLENLCEEGLELKQQLVREFEGADLRTYKLCFAIKMHLKSGLMGSVIIKKRDADVFDILHTPDFNPNSKEYVGYKSKVAKNDLSGHLITLCHNYYDLLIDNIAFLPQQQNDMDDDTSSQQLKLLFQCENCLSIYDEAHGDEINGIAPGTSFTAIDNNYMCPVCDGEKESYKPKFLTII